MKPLGLPLERWEQHALLTYARRHGFGQARRLAVILQAQRMAQFADFIQRNVPVLDAGAQQETMDSLEQRLCTLFDE